MGFNGSFLQRVTNLVRQLLIRKWFDFTNSVGFEFAFVRRMVNVRKCCQRDRVL